MMDVWEYSISISNSTGTGYKVLSDTLVMVWN
jgi:hypothetical protein